MAVKPLHPATLAAQALGWIDEQTGAVVLPVHTATTFLRDPDNQYRRGRNYARADNASYDQPEALITALEGGAASLLFASGMAAAAAVFHSLPAGSHVIASVVMYHSLRRQGRRVGRVARHRLDPPYAIIGGARLSVECRRVVEVRAQKESPAPMARGFVALPFKNG